MAFITKKSFWRSGRISVGLANRRSAGLTTQKMEKHASAILSGNSSRRIPYQSVLCVETTSGIRGSSSKFPTRGSGWWVMEPRSIRASKFADEQSRMALVSRLHQYFATARLCGTRQVLAKWRPQMKRY
jgi:hypothetical protein